MYSYEYVHEYKYTYIYIYTHIYICIHTHTHTHTQAISAIKKEAGVAEEHAGSESKELQSCVVQLRARALRCNALVHT